MKVSLLVTLMVVVFAGCASKESNGKKKEMKITEQSKNLMKVVEFTGTQVTGVTVSSDGRMFASFPRWRKNVPFSVVEILNDGSTRPYPDEEWNKWNGKVRANHFTCVQSVLAHGNSLFILDPSSPNMEGVVGSAMLYEFDLATNDLKKSWKFPKRIAPTKSYLNDLRIDDDLKKIFITDSGLGAIVEVDLKTGNMERNLDKHPSTSSELVTLEVNDKPFLIKGQSPRIHSDGIALDDQSNMLYYHALTSKTLYRVPAHDISAQNVENLGQTPAPDGMIFDKKGNLYMADLERNAIVYRTPEGEMKTLIQDDDIGWADSFAIDNNNNLIFTDSRLGDAPAGTPVDTMKFTVYKVPLPIEIKKRGRIRGPSIKVSSMIKKMIRENECVFDEARTEILQFHHNHPTLC